MSQKWIGSILVIAGCGGIGFSMAAAHRKAEGLIQQLIRILDVMEWELQYRVTPLPELCKIAAKESPRPLREVFLFLSEEMMNQGCADASSCMRRCLASNQELPQQIQHLLQELGTTLGQFDLRGQIGGLTAVRSMCVKTLEELAWNRNVRLRGYETLGICAGAALAILLN